MMSVLTVALASLIFALHVQVKRRREGRPHDFTTRRKAHEAGMIWGSSAFEKRRAALGGRKPSRFFRAALLAGVGLAIGAGTGRAETIGGALIKAYLTSPDINTQRAAVRVADENVPKANAGYLPTIEAHGEYWDRARASQ